MITTKKKLETLSLISMLTMNKQDGPSWKEAPKRITRQKKRHSAPTHPKEPIYASLRMTHGMPVRERGILNGIYNTPGPQVHAHTLLPQRIILLGRTEWTHTTITRPKKHNSQHTPAQTTPTPAPPKKTRKRTKPPQSRPTPHELSNKGAGGLTPKVQGVVPHATYHHTLLQMPRR